MDEIEKQEALNQAIKIAQNIIDGTQQPNVGCEKLGDLNQELDWPDDLSAFGLLSHDQYDHENLGMTAENCIPEIIEECKKLVRKYC